jgi:hypothetical protein
MRKEEEVGRKGKRERLEGRGSESGKWEGRD